MLTMWECGDRANNTSEKRSETKPPWLTDDKRSGVVTSVIGENVALNVIFSYRAYLCATV